MIVDFLLERDFLPDSVLRLAIRKRLKNTLNEHKQPSPELQQQKLNELIQELKSSPIAINTLDANEQHYEVPADFYNIVLGPRLKYSSCLWNKGEKSLEASEEAMLRLTVQRADIENGRSIVSDR